MQIIDELQEFFDASQCDKNCPKCNFFMKKTFQVTKWPPVILLFITDYVSCVNAIRPPPTKINLTDYTSHENICLNSGSTYDVVSYLSWKDVSNMDSIVGVARYLKTWTTNLHSKKRIKQGNDLLQHYATASIIVLETLRTLVADYLQSFLSVVDYQHTVNSAHLFNSFTDVLMSLQQCGNEQIQRLIKNFQFSKKNVSLFLTSVLLRKVREKIRKVHVHHKHVCPVSSDSNGLDLHTTGVHLFIYNSVKPMEAKSITKHSSLKTCQSCKQPMNNTLLVINEQYFTLLPKKILIVYAEEENYFKVVNQQCGLQDYETKIGHNYRLSAIIITTRFSDSIIIVKKDKQHGWIHSDEHPYNKTKPITLDSIDVLVSMSKKIIAMHSILRPKEQRRRIKPKPEQNSQTLVPGAVMDANFPSTGVHGRIQLRPLASMDDTSKKVSRPWART
ncbi:unnamed protein product, partial [Didymodactylos carnosus]